MTKYILLLALAMQSTFALASTATPDAKKTTVTGLIYKEYFYEQPNYGENPQTDEIAWSCMLKLDEPLQLNKNVIYKIQLYDIKRCETLLGHRVELSGELSEPTTGHHHGDAMIDISTAKVLR